VHRFVYHCRPETGAARVPTVLERSGKPIIPVSGHICAAYGDTCPVQATAE
jgi:hypothetical protein